MARPVVEIDPKSVAKFNAAIRDLAAFSSGSRSARVSNNVGKIMRREMGLLVERCIQFTPPFTGARGGATQARKLGEGAIRTDLRKIVDVESRAHIARLKAARAKEKKQMKQLEAEGLLSYLGLKWVPENFVKARSLIKSMGTAEGVINWMLDEGGTILPKHHQANRRPSDGRVVETKGQRAGVVIGVQKYVDILIVKSVTMKNYLREVYKRVGRAKGGWNFAATMFKAKRPAWVSRHGTGEGGAVDAMGATGGYLEAVNRVPYIGRLDGRAGIVNNALQTRARDIRTKIQAAMDYEIRKFNRG